jgi:acylphosphatase
VKCKAVSDSAAYLVVHGNVQGVGYRHLVYIAAKRNGIKGIVRNEEDGSVSIIATGADQKMEQFIAEIDVDYAAGPSVVNIERLDLGSDRFPASERGKEYSEFLIVE